MGKIVTDKFNFASVLFDDLPPIGSYIVAFDIADDKLKKMDHNGVLTVIGDGAGGGDLAEVLGNGNITGGSNIVMSNGDFITSANGLMHLDFGSGTYFRITPDGGAGLTSSITLLPGTSQIGYGSFVHNADVTGAYLTFTSFGDAPFVYVTSTEAFMSHGLAGTKKISIGAASISLKHATEILIDTPGATTDYIPFINSTKSLVASYLAQDGSGIRIDNTKLFSSADGEIQLDLGSGAYFQVTTDAGVFGASAIYMDDTFSEFSNYSAGARGVFIESSAANGKAIKMIALGITDHIGFLSSADRLFAAGIGIGGINVIGDAALSFASSNFEDSSTIISSKGSTVNASVVNSVILGGSGFTASANNTVYTPHIVPGLDNTYDLGTSTEGWANLYLASNIHYASDLLFQTSASEKMRLTTGGNLGIGTTPSSKLHVEDLSTIQRGVTFEHSFSSSAGPNIESFEFISSHDYNGTGGNHAGLIVHSTLTGTIVSARNHAIQAQNNGGGDLENTGIFSVCAGTTGGNIGAWMRFTGLATSNTGIYIASDLTDTANNYALNFSSPAKSYHQGRFGIGHSSATAKLHVQGEGSSSATYPLKIDNLAASPLLYVRDDIFVSVNTTTQDSLGLEKFRVEGKSLATEVWAGSTSFDNTGISDVRLGISSSASGNAAESLILFTDSGGGYPSYFTNKTAFGLYFTVAGSLTTPQSTPFHIRAVGSDTGGLTIGGDVDNIVNTGSLLVVRNSLYAVGAHSTLENASDDTGSASYNLDTNVSAGVLANFGSFSAYPWDHATAPGRVALYASPSASEFMIQSDANDGIKFLIGNTEKMRLHDNGFLGIGISTPTSFLSIDNSADGNVACLDLQFSGGLGGMMLLNRDASTTDNQGFFWQTGGTTKWFTGIIQNDDSFYFRKNSSSGTTVLGLDYTNERVGIGIDAPLLKLDVRHSSSQVLPASGATTDGSINIRNNDSTAGNYMLLNFQSSNNDGAGTFGVQVNDHTGGGVISNFFWAFPNGLGDVAMQLFDDGDLSLGTGLGTNSARLHVKGSGATSATFSLKIENSGATELFQVRNDGYIYAGVDQALTIGKNSGFLTGNIYQTLIGINIAPSIAAGAQYNTAVGNLCFNSLSTGFENSAFGYGTLQSITTQSRNSAFGIQAGQLTTGSDGLFLGAYAGQFETGGSKLYIDTKSRTNEADARVKALIYGEFASTPDAQKVRVNANLEIHAVSSGFSGSEHVTKQAGVQTLDDTPTNIATIALADGEMIQVEAKINGFASDFSAGYSSVRYASFRKSGGTVTQISTGAAVLIDDDLGASTAIEVNGSSGVKITVTGPTISPDITVNWVTTYSYFKTLTNS